jgi:hypothetical protein
MPRTSGETLEQVFAEFHASLKPRPGESKRVRKHRAAIRACLVSGFELRTFSQCGSFGNGTSIARFSDTDYLAHMPVSQFSTNSKEMLGRVRATLKQRFPQTDIRVNSPAVKVPFGSLPSETTEVVPGKQCGKTETGHAIYEIADGAGGWMRTSPNAHNAYVRARNEILKGRLKPLICFMKAWKYFNGVPVSSFYLEMRTAQYMANKATVVYDRDLAGLFARLAEGLSDLRDPVGVSGLIRPCSTPTKATETCSKLATGAGRADKALCAASRGDVTAASKWWRLLFAGRFPTLGN